MAFLNQRLVRLFFGAEGREYGAAHRRLRARAFPPDFHWATPCATNISTPETVAIPFSRRGSRVGSSAGVDQIHGGYGSVTRRVRERDFIVRCMPMGVA